MFLTGCLFILDKISLAQSSPEMFITWESSNYAPNNYKGKILPIESSVVSASVLVIDNGKIADLSRAEIRWFSERKLLGSGVGLTGIKFEIPINAISSARIEAEIINYKGGATLEDFIRIPIARPEVVIEASGQLSEKIIIAGINTIKALPYFFNINSLEQLSFTWEANNQEIKEQGKTGETLELDITDGAGNLLNLGVKARNNIKNIEFARSLLNLEIKE